MVGRLTVDLGRMKLAVLRHSLHGPRLERLSWGVLFGVAGIAATVWTGLTTFDVPGLGGDLLAGAFLLWGLGWALGPILFTGEDTTLRPEHFRSLPVTARRLAVGLLGASFVGVPVIVSLLAFTALVAYGARLGPGAAAVAVPATLLQLLLVVVVSRLVTAALRTVVRSQLSAALSAVVTGAVMAFFVSGWFVFVNLGDLTERGVPRAVATAVRVAPSGWVVVTVDAAAEGRWVLAAGALAGMALLTVAAFLAWSVLLRRRLTTRPATGRGRVRLAAPAAWAASPVGGVVRKELLTWRRDYTRGGFVYFAFFYSVFVCLYPLTAGVDIALPLVGVVFVVTATGSTANLYGADGSALWLTLTRPGAARADVRGRQLAWLAVTAPIALLSTLVAVAATGLWATLPGATALVVAVLGAGAGLTVLHSVYRPTAMVDPHKRGDDMFDHSIDWSQFMLLLVALVVVTAPVWGLVWLAVRQQAIWPQWAALGAAVPLAVACYLGFGALAHRRLAARGPELLNLLRHGRAPERARPEPGQGAKGTLDALPARSQAGFYLVGFVGVIALFPQGLVPLVRSLVEDDPDPVWFLALFLPDPWRWVVIAVMTTVGAVGTGYAASRYLAARRAVTLPSSAQPPDRPGGAARRGS